MPEGGDESLFTVKTETDPVTLRAECGEAGVEYSPRMRLSVLREEGEVRGSALCGLYDGYAVVYTLKPGDNPALADGVLRAALNTALSHGCFSVYYGERAPEELLLKLGFVLDKKERRLATHLLFGGCGAK